MGLRDEILEQTAAAQRVLDSAPKGVPLDLRRGQVAPDTVRSHRRSRHLGQRSLAGPA